MRIAQIAPRGVHPYSGLLASLVHVSAALAQQGIQVEVWQLHPWTDENAQMTALLEAAGIELVAIDVGDSQWRLSSRASHQIAQRRVDIAHLHGVFNPTNTAVARELEVPYAISPHGGYAAESLSYHRWRKSAFKFALELPMLRRAAAVSALTEQESNEVRDFGFEGRVLVIPNGVRPIATDLDADAFRGELGLDRSTALAMYAGRIDTRGKRLGDVVRAVAGNARWHLALMGGDFRGGIDEAARLCLLYTS